MFLNPTFIFIVIACAALYLAISFYALAAAALSERYRHANPLKIYAVAIFWPLSIIYSMTIGHYLHKRKRRVVESEATMLWGETKRCRSCGARALPANSFGVRCLNCDYLN